MTHPLPLPDRSVRLVHAITATGIGGAQSMLAKLLSAGDGVFDRYEQSVLSLMALGEIGLGLAGRGVAVHTLGLRGAVPSPAAMLRLFALTRSLAPDLLMGWMHHAGLVAYYAARMLRRPPPLIWNVRHSLSDVTHEKAATRVILRHCRRLSGRVDAIIYNSHVARAQYEAFGYAADRAVVIPNGFDCDHFRPRADARARLRLLFALDGTRPVVGMIVRNHPMKDPATLIAAMRGLWAEGRDADLLIVGPGMEALRQTLDPEVFQGVPEKRIILSGQRMDLAEWLPGLDLLVLPSAWGEAFPNILGEAMACGVPCVATDVGDAHWIIGDHDQVVPPGDAAALGAAIGALLSLPADVRQQCGLEGRDRVIEQFSLAAVARAYAALYDSLMPEQRGRSRGDIAWRASGAL